MPRLAILFTTGPSDDLNVQTEAVKLKSNQVTLLTIGITDKVDAQQLNKLASAPYSKYSVLFKNTTLLLNSINNVNKIICETPISIKILQNYNFTGSKNQVKQFQVDYSGTDLVSTYNLDVRISNLKGYTSFLYDSVFYLYKNSTIGKLEQNQVQIKNIIRNDDDSIKALSFILIVHQNTEIAYFKMKSTEDDCFFEMKALLYEPDQKLDYYI